MGAGESLVGITRYCIHPREALLGKERVGGTKNPNLARIRALSPSLVLMNAEENRAKDIEELSRELAVDVSHPKTVAEVPPLLRRWGRLIDRAEQAEAHASRIEAEIETGSTRPGTRFRYVYLIWREPWMTVNDGTYIADLLRLAGGVNTLGALPTPYPAVPEQAILEAAPDVILLPDEPYRFRERDAEYLRSRLPHSAVLLVSGDDLCWHGVRTLKGIEAAHAISSTLAARPSRSVAAPRDLAPSPGTA